MLRILLVEDEINLRNGFRHLLEHIIGGVQVAGELSNGLEAMEWLMVNTADAVLTDIRMKEMNGIEMLRRLRGQYPELPVVIVSGYNDFEYARDALRYHAADYLLKPVDKAELALVIDRLKKGFSKSSFQQHEAEAPVKEGLEERQIIRKVKELIDLHLDQSISLQYLADQVHLNHRYLSALFKSETGQNLSEYVTQCRMKKAKQLLKTTHMKVQDIGRMSGYPNGKYFMSLFKQIVGLTPSEFREQA
ncbi:response regulator [Paenibacillus filicis]|uniref:Response regulator n=1 Tax=Paenibacillus filicis TaxID=669464 RepID=A0ABU9DHG3_9BACL